jgi:hypothetical protein
LALQSRLNDQLRLTRPAGLSTSGLKPEERLRMYPAKDLGAAVSSASPRNTRPLSNGLYAYSAFFLVGQAMQLAALLLISLRQLGAL